MKVKSADQKVLNFKGTIKGLTGLYEVKMPEPYPAHDAGFVRRTRRVSGWWR